jgi:ATP-dependent Clp protease ATP-binding subunit ClpA
LSVTAAATDFLLAEGNDPDTGAWAIRRAVERHLTDPLTNTMLRGELAGWPGVQANLDEYDDRRRLMFTPHEPPAGD